MTHLQSILRRLHPDSDQWTGNLAEPALEIATIQYPGLNPKPFLTELDAWGEELRQRTQGLTGRSRLQEICSYLFDKLRFTGNDEAYYDPRNSCLNQVMERRTGIPITLTLVYLEVCRRAGIPAFGIGMPGHFLAEYDDGIFQSYLDPFEGGRLLNAADCLEVVRRRAGIPEPCLELLERAKLRQILIRMLFNLRGIYSKGADWQRACRVLDLLIEADPADGGGWRQRGAVLLALGRLKEAQRDLEQYLLITGGAEDRGLVERQIRLIQKQKATTN